MTKVDEIMYLAFAFANAVHESGMFGSNDNLKCEELAETKLQTAIESLAEDAEQWRTYKARKDAVMAAGMGRNALRKEQGEES